MSEIKRQKVKSSNVVSIGYDEILRVLAVEFNPTKKHLADGTENVYFYPGFPKPVFDEFLEAKSVGKFFHAHVRGKYKAFRVQGEE